jgi:hypothetical protein
MSSYGRQVGRDPVFIPVHAVYTACLSQRIPKNQEINFMHHAMHAGRRSPGYP